MSLWIDGLADLSACLPQELEVPTTLPPRAWKINLPPLAQQATFSVGPDSIPRAVFFWWRFFCLSYLSILSYRYPRSAQITGAINPEVNSAAQKDSHARGSSAALQRQGLWKAPHGVCLPFSQGTHTHTHTPVSLPQTTSCPERAKQLCREEGADAEFSENCSIFCLSSAPTEFLSSFLDRPKDHVFYSLFWVPLEVWMQAQGCYSSFQAIWGDFFVDKASGGFFKPTEALGD